MSWHNEMCIHLLLLLTFSQEVREDSLTSCPLRSIIWLSQSQTLVLQKNWVRSIDLRIGYLYIGWFIFAFTESRVYIYQFGASGSSQWYPVVVKRSALRGSSEVVLTVRLRKEIIKDGWFSLRWISRRWQMEFFHNSEFWPKVLGTKC